MVFIPISSNASSSGIPTVVTTDIYISGYYDPCILPVLPYLVEPHIKLTGGSIITRTGLSAPMFYFVNRTTGWWSAISFTVAECADMDTSVDAFSTSLPLHNYVALLYCDSMSHPHIILSGLCHITNWYCNNSAFHLCTT